MLLITIVAFILILSVLVLAHEFGHFISAKAFGVKVEEFAIFMPPKIYSFKRGETTYTINAIPFGGYTKMLGEVDPNFPRSLASKSHAIRFIILASGAIMNVLLPILLFAISFMIPHAQIIEQVQISQVAIDSPAQAAGLEIGDTILKINNNVINNRGDLSYFVELDLGSKVNMLIKKSDQTEKVVTLVPRWKPPAGQGAIGIEMQGVDTKSVTTSMPFWEAFPQGAVHSWQIIVLTKNAFEQSFIAGTVPQFTGPIGVAQLTGEVVQAGITPLLEFAAIISISLGIFNLFPIPGLDGGRILFVVIEWFRRGKRISPEKEGLVHTIGFILLIVLLIVISYFDIMRIISGTGIGP
jgi:regulator of sigma E protease